MNTKIFITCVVLSILIFTIINILVLTTVTHLLKNFYKKFNPVINYTPKSVKEKFDAIFEQIFNYFKWDFLNSITGQLVFQFSFLWFYTGLCRSNYIPVYALCTLLINSANSENPFNPGEQIISNFTNYNTHGPAYLKLTNNKFEQAALTTVTIATQRNVEYTYVNTKNLQESIEKNDAINEQRFLADTTQFFKILKYYYKCVWEASLDPKISKQMTMTNHFYECITDHKDKSHRHFCVQYTNAKEGITYFRFYTLTSTGIPAGTAVPAEILADHSRNKYTDAGIIRMVDLPALKGGKTSLIPPTGKFVEINESLISECQQILYTKGTLLQAELLKSSQYKLVKVIRDNKDLLDILGLYPAKGQLTQQSAVALSNQIIAFDMSALKENLRTDLTVIPKVQLITQQCEENLEIAMHKVENTKTLSPIQQHINATTIGKIIEPQEQCIHVNKLQKITIHPVTTTYLKQLIGTAKRS